MSDVLSDAEVAATQAQHHPSCHYADLCDNDGDDWPCFVARALARIDRDRELLRRCLPEIIRLMTGKIHDVGTLARLGQLLADLKSAGVEE